MSTQIVVAGALIEQGRLLVAQRDRPPELAGCWELPGGKVGSGEADAQALRRELLEELGIDVRVGDRLGSDIALGPAVTLRAYLVTRMSGEPHPHDHRALRWVGASDIDNLNWVPADRAWLPDLAALLHR
ncbi:(deoxy)nucleoside triphosphate pyrophosphohydrolase [Mycolicibacterium sp. 018/SC-01/001]|uniref:(deoxy)nucleoside triphosphate pyrophosphohydrolase n=1 Tax=Mycolicibacterium sp. 018/SC-01/001 TaxID=2592069 RepID=UPI00117EBF02|nr:(deoxy)nucleoside triphosphate pyrophosphohydrolase [Mycolicibacterium sp. 018/SC-01/001]TRW79369.1 (deoxy)nucleoside triphosphate pyrophosphohydrolase [Mycolicibacterium sp. 018/SC-01/001]